MVNGIRTGNLFRFNKRRSSKFRVGSRIRQTPKRCGNSNKEEENSQNTLNDKTHQASSQKFRQINIHFTLLAEHIVVIL